MPPINPTPVAGTAEDRLDLLMQRIRKEEDERRAKPPANAPNGPGALSGANGPKGSPQEDQYQAPGASDDQTVSTRNRTVKKNDPAPAHPETNRRQLDTHLNEGQQPAPRSEARTNTDTNDDRSPAADLPTYGERFKQQQAKVAEERRTQQQQFRRDLMERLAADKPAADPLTRSPKRNAVDCRDCHPSKQPDFSANDFHEMSKFLQGTRRPLDTPASPTGAPPAKIDHAAIKDELDAGFDTAATGMTPTERGQLAQDYSNRLAMDESPNGRKYERGFRTTEAERLKAAAGAEGVDASDRDRLQAQSHDLERRPMSESTRDFVGQLETMSVSDLSHRDAKAALSTIRAHKPADSSAYDPRTGIKPGNDDMFYSKEDEAKLFNPSNWETPPPVDLAAESNQMRRLFNNSTKCYDCHPDPTPQQGFDFPKFDRDLGQDFTERLAQERQEREQKLTEGVDNKIAAEHPGVKKGSDAYQQLDQRHRDENRLRQKLQFAGNNPKARLKIPEAQLDAEQKRVLDDHVANKRLNELEKKIRPRFNELDAQYVKNGWSEDSPFYGVDREAFLKDVADKPVDRVSDYDRFRALGSLESFKTDNPEMFDRDSDSFESFRERVREHEAAQRPALDLTQQNLLNGTKCYDCHPDPKQHDGFKLDLRDYDSLLKAPTFADPAPPKNAPTSDLYYRDRAEMQKAGLNADDITSRMTAAREDPNNPIPYLKSPMDELDNRQHKQVSEDYTRHSIEKMEQDLRAGLVDKIGGEVNKLDKTFDRILEDQGVIGDFADMLKNNIGREDGWVIDSNLGSNAVVNTIGEAYAAKNQLHALKNFKGSHEEFVKAYQDRIGNLKEKINAVPRHIDKFQQSQGAWVEGISDIASVTAALGAAALAPVTGGASLLVGAAAGAITKVGTKGLEAVTGSGEYQGSIPLDLLKGGINGASATGTNMLAQAAAKKMLASSASRLVGGQSVSMLTRAGIWGTTTVGEGALDGYIVGTSTSLLDGKSFGESQMNGLRGAAFGAVLNPIGQGSMNGLKRLWKGKLSIDSVDDALKGIDDATKGWPDSGKGVKQRARVERLREELDLAKKLLDQNRTPKTEAAAREVLDATKRFREAAEAYGALESPKRPSGQRTPEELAAHRQKVEDYKTRELELRQEFVDAYQSSQKATYEALRKTAGISVEPLDPTKAGPFGRRPMAEIEKLKLDAEGPNRAYAELEVDGKKEPIGPTRSGGGPEEATPNNPYELESRALERVNGQHNKSRANDSEVRLLGLVNDALTRNGGKPGTLRIFTELPPCSSCQRVMAKFRADHPNVNIEVYHLPQ